jgi:hypothetical protein
MGKLIRNEGRIHGARYHTIKPEFDWQHHVGLQNNNWRNMIEWCVEVFGPSAKMGVWQPGSRWYANNAKFWFREEEDAIMFILRWS